ncbi:MAG TPA: PaaI family thioesterase, partial [Kofleriaceae bacterium]|nr:PaaI family thioesterase [Kofleriaceae bacterium]
YPATSGQGFRCDALGEGYAVTRWRHDPAELRPGGLISGPTQFTAADLALWFLSFTVFGLAAMALTSDLHIVFLRPARGGDLLARAELLRGGKRRISGRVLTWVDGDPERPVSHATGTYVLTA